MGTTTLLPRRPRPCCVTALAGRSPGSEETGVDCTRCGARLVAATGGGWVIDVPVEDDARPEARRIPASTYQGRGLRARQDGQGVGRATNPIGFVPPTPERFRQAAARGLAKRASTTHAGGLQ